MHVGALLGLNRVISAVDIAAQATLRSTGGSLYHGVLANLVDGDDATICTLAIAPNNAFIFDFAAPVSMGRVRLGLNGGTHTMYCRICYSDDNGVTWADTNQPSIVKNIEATITSYDLDDFGLHRTWAVVNSVNWYLQFTTIAWHPRVLV